MISSKHFAARSVFWALLLSLALASSAGAEEERKPFRLRGNFRTIGAAVQNYDFPLFFGDDEVDAFSQSLLRGTISGEPWEALSYEIHGVQSLDATSTSGSPQAPFGLTEQGIRYRVLDASWEWLTEQEVEATLWLDRASVKVSFPFADLTLGRQAVTFGEAYFWNPLDVFLAFDPRQFDREYKPGVDAARLDVPLGDFSGVNVIAAAGRTILPDGTFEGGEQALEATWFGSAALGRIFTNVEGWSLTAQGGKVYGGYQAGGGATGEIKEIEVRLEAAHLFADGGPFFPVPVPPPTERVVESGTTVVAGVGRRFENTLHLQAEYFYNGLGDSEDLAASFVRFQTGGSLDMSRHLLALAATYEILPILTGEVAFIVAPEDPSLQIQPRLTWSAADEIEVLAGAIVNAGERPEQPAPGLIVPQSEFGTFPNFYYAEFKVYF